MLKELTITNFAIIDELRVRFGPGLNVITGESGAGKSIIVDAMGAVLGEKVGAEVVRTGSSSARVEGVFQLERADITSLSQELDLEDGEDTLAIFREIGQTGRSLCRINGRATPVGALHRIGQILVDIHGQSEHLSLLRPAEHITILDRYAGLMEQRSQLEGQVSRLRQVSHELEKLRRDERELSRRADFLRFQVQEIEVAKLQPGEEAELEEELKLLGNAEQRASLADAAHSAITENREGSASLSELLDEVVTSLAELAKLDARLSQEAEAVQNISYQIEDLAGTLRSYGDSVDFSPQRLTQVSERLDLIRSLKRKYGNSIEEVLRFAQEAFTQLEGISHSEERTAELEEEQKKLLSVIGELAGELSRRRLQAASELSRAVEEQLVELDLPKVRFAVDIRQELSVDGVPVALAGDDSAEKTDCYSFDQTGIDKVEFLISVNPGEPLRPLAKVASGGETSRVMLALKSVFSKADTFETLIFDEIETGIGGRNANTVAQKLSNLAKEHQVIFITHLPQMACFADTHLYVEKAEVEGRTTVQVQELEGVARRDELAKMLGGVTEANRRSADEMLKNAAYWKRGEKPGPKAVKSEKSEAQTSLW